MHESIPLKHFRDLCWVVFLKWPLFLDRMFTFSEQSISLKCGQIISEWRHSSEWWCGQRRERNILQHIRQTSPHGYCQCGVWNEGSLCQIWWWFQIYKWNFGMSPYKSFMHNNIGKTTDSMDFEIEYMFWRNQYFYLPYPWFRCTSIQSILCCYLIINLHKQTCKIYPSSLEYINLHPLALINKVIYYPLF